MKSFSIAILLASLVAVIGRADESDGRPNVIVLLCDDLGYGDLQCYGHPHIRTPNLDGLAENGIRLTQCYSAAPVCSPSRAGLLTGRSPNRAGIYDWIPEAPRTVNDAASDKLDDHRSLVHLKVDEVTIASILRDAGYETAMAGKYHCNSRFNSSDQPGPGDHGFEHWLATQNNAAPSHYQPVNFVRNSVPVEKVDGYSCQFVVDEAMRFIRTVDDAPYFVYIPFHEPHEPVASPPEITATYEEVASTQAQAEYFANVENVDTAVGRLVAFLKERGDLENTLIVFTSDNGPETLMRYSRAEHSYGRAHPLRGMKLWTTDGGFRVPGIIHWPAAIAAGQTRDQPVSSLDLLPTLATIGGGELPDRLLDGTDISDWLRGDGAIARTKPLVWTYFNALNEHQVAVRYGDYKILAKIDGLKRLRNLTQQSKQRVESLDLTDIEIYDVVEDIDESDNLIDTMDDSEELIEVLKRSYHGLLADSPVW